MAITDLINKFYVSFQQRDYRGMQSCYHDEIIFSDPVFRKLKGKRAKAMWHMLVENGKDLQITYENVKGDEKSGSCHWEAWYTFSATGRSVHNVIDAVFEFKDDKIIQHNDHFNFWIWSRMALGNAGVFMGWTSYLHDKIRSRANESLDRFILDHPEYR